MLARTILVSSILLWCGPPVAAGAAAAAAPAGATAPGPDRDARASRLLALAERLLADQRIETRRLAIEALETAGSLAPDRADIQLVLGRAYYQAGFYKQSR